MLTSDADSYIVRVYRRSSDDPPQLVGIVEQVRTGRETPFHSIEELWQVLTSRQAGSAAARRPSRSSRRR
jgi:hypothetical protein